MADLADTIRSIPLFSGLSREDVAKIMGHLVEVEFARGDKIFSQGDSGDALYLIQSGAAHVQLDSGGGRSDHRRARSAGVFWRDGVALVGSQAILQSRTRERNHAVRKIVDSTDQRQLARFQRWTSVWRRRIGPTAALC